jgi:hypothetical protein
LIEAFALLRSPAVIRFRVLLGTALILSAIIGTFVHAQLTDEEKKKHDARTKAREEMRAVASPAPAETPEPTAKPKPANRKAKSTKKVKATPTPRPKKSPTPEAEDSPKPKSKAKATSKTDEEDEEPTPKPKRTASTEEDETPQSTKEPGVEKSPTPKPKTKSGTEKTSKKNEEAKATPTPKPKPKPKRKKKASSEETAGSTKTPRPRKSPIPEPEESPTPKPDAKKKTEGTKEAIPKRIEKAEAAKTPAPTEKVPKAVPELMRTPAPEPAVRPPPVSTLPQAALPTDITIEKSGLEKEQGLEPPPPPPPRRGFWPWSRQQPTNYRYLTSATIDAIRRAPVQRARWKFVIVHNSGTRQGNARAFDYYHRKIRRMRNGLAYHFVIGNGTSSRNGQIEIGDRWRRQINGGHVHSDYMNNIGLGICLVGDFNRDQPTRAQLEACEELIRYLQERCGKMTVRPHREVNPPRWATDCPGDAFPYAWFGRFR